MPSPTETPDLPPAPDAPTGPGPVLAAIDIGTNSVHMVVARVGANGRIEILEREREMVRLGRASGDMKQLAPDAIERAVAALRRCRDVADAHGAEVRAVATSAVREAENRRDFLDRARDESGIDVDVISGLEEARLIHLGVLKALPLFESQLLLCDIGGGSTEFVVGLRGEVLASRSLKLGSIRMTERFFADGGVSPGRARRCRHDIRSILEPFAVDVRRLGFEQFVMSSGTAQTVATMAIAERGDEIPRTLNGARCTAAEVAAVVELVLGRPDRESRARLPGADPKRADLLPAGVLVVDEVMRTFGAEELVISDYALREGVLLDTARRRSGATLHHLRDIRRESVLHLVELADDTPEHSMKTASLALQLYDSLAPLHGLGDAARELLEAGALLCNVGVSIAHAGHHKHSYYVVRNSEQLTGFTDREIELIALITRYHRKSAPKAKHPEFAVLRPDDQQLVTTLAAITRVAIGLDRGHAGRVASVRAEWTDDELRVLVTPAPGESVELECFAAEVRSDLLAAVFDRTTSVHVHGVAA